MFDKIKAIQSSDQNVMKFVFSRNDAVAEAVLYRYGTYEERTVICCSTQSGCPVGCRFCGAGDSFVRSLSGEEIVFQVQHLIESRGINASKIQRFQIMFMSMGEPFLNPKGLKYALEKLYEMYPNAALLVSSIGPRVDYRWFLEISKQIPTIGLQFSVHEPTDEARSELIPFKQKLSLKEIAELGNIWAGAAGRQPFFNYCAHEHNNTRLDATRLFMLFNPEIWQATISVVCERDESVAAANERQRFLANNFQRKLQDFGFSTRMFDPAGQDDIGGGCGQLWYVQSWMKNNPDLARPSVGRGLPIIHTPGTNQ